MSAAHVRSLLSIQRKYEQLKLKKVHLTVNLDVFHKIDYISMITFSAEVLQNIEHAVGTVDNLLYKKEIALKVFKADKYFT